MSPMQRVAAVTGMTEGQSYTMAIGLALALVTAAIGIPPTLRDRVVPVTQSRPDATAPPATTADEQPAATPEPPGPDTSGTPSVLPAPSGSDFGGGGGGDTAAPPPTSGFGGDRSDGGSDVAQGGSLGDVEEVGSAIGSPHGIAVDPATGGFFVATAEGSVLRFAPSGLQEESYDVPGELTGVLLEGDRLIVLDGPGGNVIELDVTSGTHRTIATIASSGLPGQEPLLHSVVRGATGDLLVSDAAQAVIWQVDASGEVSEWYRGPELLTADGAGPAGMSFDPGGDLIVAVSRSAVALTGAVYRIAVEPDGAAGVGEELFRSLPDATLSGVAVGQQGRIYVAAAGSDELLVLEADGTEVTTIVDSALDGPIGLAFRGDSLLVTNQSGTILRAPVEDRASP